MLILRFMIFILFFVSCSSVPEMVSYELQRRGYRTEIYVKGERKMVPVPEHAFGELIVDKSSGRFLYKFWDDYKRENLLVDKKTRYWRVFSGYDGEKFWVANFYQYGVNEKSLRAETVYIYKNISPALKNNIKKSSQDDGSGLLTEGGSVSRNLHEFFKYAPFHELLSRINSRSLNRADLLPALKKSPLVTIKDGLYIFTPETEKGQDHLPGHWKRRRGGDWKFNLILDESHFPLERVTVMHMSEMWSGIWPYMTESDYFIQRKKTGLTRDDIFKAETYSDGKTEFVDPFLEDPKDTDPFLEDPESPIEGSPSKDPFSEE